MPLKRSEKLQKIGTAPSLRQHIRATLQQILEAAAQGLAVCRAHNLRVTLDEMCSSAPLEFPASKREPIRVLVADDNASMRKIIREFLEELPRVEICDVVASG